MHNIGYFPSLYQGEIFYGGCARLKSRMLIESETKLNKILFEDNRRKIGLIELPRGLEGFINRLGMYSIITTEDVIFNHTLFPYYFPFLNENKRKILENHLKIKDDKNFNKYQSLGIISRIAPLSHHLKYCPLCVKNDREDVDKGEAYWHIEHQLPGVQFCLKHQVRLLSFHFPNGINKHIHLDDIELDLINIINFDKNSSIDVYWMGIAEDSIWLLENGMNLTAGKTFEKYGNLLNELGFGFSSDKIARHRLEERFQKHLSEFFPNSERHIEIERISNFVNLLLLPHQTSCPIFHIIATRILGVSISTLLTSSDNRRSKPNHFGTGPWYCMNPVCIHNKKRVVHNCLVYLSSTKRIIGVFLCECGYKYKVYAEDFSPFSYPKVGGVLEYGHVWEKLFRDLWNDGNFKLRDIIERLGLTRRNYSLINRMARNMGLECPRFDTKFYSESIISQPMTNQIVCIPSNDKNENREIWLKALELIEENRIMQLRRVYGGLYRWLEKYDNDWIKSHNPYPNVSKFLTRYVNNWPEWDEQIYSEYKNAYEKIINQNISPIKISLPKLLIVTGNKKFIFTNKDKLAKSNNYIKRIVDTPETFAIRKIYWGISYFIEKGYLPSINQFTGFLGIFRQSNIPLVINEREEALRQIGLLTKK
jgi:hypothetical protein